MSDPREYLVAIPEPYYGVWKRCECGRKFWTYAGYQGHWLLEHYWRQRGYLGGDMIAYYATSESTPHER